MQITEQIIQRIARQVFNQMFPSSLRQSGAVISGAGSSVQYAVEAGHAAAADSATSASSVPWSGVSSKPATATRWPSWSEVTDKPTFATVATSGSYADLSNKPTIPTPSAVNTGYAANADNALDSDKCDGLHVHSGRNNEANKIVRTDGNGYMQCGWINTTSGGFNEGTSINKVYCSNDDYIRYLSSSDFFPTLANDNNQISITVAGQNRKLTVDYATAASKLTTVSKTAWGQTYWTSGGVPDSISGDMSSVGDISFSASGKKIGGFLYFDTTNYRLGVGVSSPSYRLQVDGQIYTNNSIHVVNSAASVHVGSSTSNRISLHWSSGNTRGLYDYTDAWLIGTDGTNTFLNKGNVGIGTSSPSYKLHVVGAIYCTSGFTFLSDINKKDVITYQWAPALSAIAEAPIIRYTLKDDKEKRERIGSVAQYWQKITPEAVTEAHDGTLSMDYGSIALTSVIALAREVKQLKAQIARLTQQRNG